MPKKFSVSIISLVLSAFLISSCHVAQKMDRYVATQFNNELPKPDKRRDSSIAVTSAIATGMQTISETKTTSKNILPLVIYWSYDYRHTCVLNPEIGVSYIRKTTFQQANKLKQKLNGRQLELKVEQIPGSFAIVDKGHFLLLVIHWYKFYVEADPKDMQITYRVLENGTEVKTGKVTVNNLQRNKGIRLFQSWKSCASEFLTQYNLDMTEMTRMALNKILLEL